jgi:nucleoside-diphosphate-sugar epimerase
LQQRDFITLTDVCAAAKHFIDLEKEELRDGLFNLGGARSIRVIDMAGLISDRAHHLLGIEVVLSVPPATDGELQTDFSLEYNIDKLLATGFSPTGEVVEEIDNTILFCHKYLVAREAH